MDLPTLQRIQLLHPAVRQEALNIYKHINNISFGKHVRLRFSNTLRSFKEQDELYAQGRTKNFDAAHNRLKKVTNAKAGQSIHNYGLAIDIVILLDKDKNGTFEAVSWDLKADNSNNGKADWLEVARYFKDCGWTWGGDWQSFPDYPHFEKTFGHTWQSLLKRHNAGDTITENINGKIYKWVNL